MGPIDPNKSPDEIDRETVEEYLARKKEREALRAAGIVVKDHSAARIRQFIGDLIRGFDEAGRADPDVARKLRDQLRREATGES